MKNTNEFLATSFADTSCKEYEDYLSSFDECYAAAKKMADLKDQILKQFFVEHVCPNIEVETDENGEPLLESFVSANTKRFELAEEMFNRYKEFEKKFV